MIKAQFIKAEPTKDGITIMLKAEKSKENLRKAVELMDERCEIHLERAETEPADIAAEQPFLDVISKIHTVIADFYNQLTATKADSQQEDNPCSHQSS